MDLLEKHIDEVCSKNPIEVSITWIKREVSLPFNLLVVYSTDAWQPKNSSEGECARHRLRASLLQLLPSSASNAGLHFSVTSPEMRVITPGGPVEVPTVLIEDPYGNGSWSLGVLGSKSHADEKNNIFHVSIEIGAKNLDTDWMISNFSNNTPYGATLQKLGEYLPPQITDHKQKIKKRTTKMLPQISDHKQRINIRTTKVLLSTVFLLLMIALAVPFYNNESYDWWVSFAIIGFGAFAFYANVLWKGRSD